MSTRQAQLRHVILRALPFTRALSKKTGDHKLRFDLGIRTLWPQWKKLGSKFGLSADLTAGLTVGCVSIPLSLAIALASGVRPEVGLVTAVVGSIVCALMGGTPLAVSGPAAAMAVLIFSIVQQYGVIGLGVVTVLCGFLQIVTGVFGLGRFVQFVPVPVIAGFTSGIGAIILVGQLPKALGIDVGQQSHIIDVIRHSFQSLHQISGVSAALAFSTVAMIFGIPRIFPKIPAALVAVVLCSTAAVIFNWSVQLIGNIPSGLPAPKFPGFPESGGFGLIGTSLIVYVIASLETLLSSSAVDKLAKSGRHDPDQELIGQGLGNIAVSLFGGIPITGVIARSGLNVQSGAKTRRAAMVHGFFLIIAVYFLSHWIGQIPIAVLSGVLLAVAIRMLNPRELLELWHASRIEAVVFLITFGAIVFVDLLAGVQAGVIAALAIAAIRLSQTRAMIHVFSNSGPHRVLIEGALTFMSSSKIEMIRSRVAQLDGKRGLIFDLTAVTSLDVSGVTLFMDVIAEARKQGTPVTIVGLPKEKRKIFTANAGILGLDALLAESEEEAIRKVGKENNLRPHKRLIYGVERFRREFKPTYDSLFKQLAATQSPHTLFITCSDSRISPNLITATDPGELFIVRNVGNIIPRMSDDSTPAEGAAIEFALGKLGVQEIVVCGHSQCGAVKSVMGRDGSQGESSAQFECMNRWLSDLRGVRNKLAPNATLEQTIEANIMQQMNNLMTYPIVRERVQSGMVRLHGWYYDIENSDLTAWNEEVGVFLPVLNQLHLKPASSAALVFATAQAEQRRPS